MDLNEIQKKIKKKDKSKENIPKSLRMYSKSKSNK